MNIVLLACLVIAVHDGDTATVRCPSRHKPIVVRVAEIDAPEMQAFTWKTQPYALESRDAASTLCLNQPSTVTLNKYDSRTKRWIAHMTCAGTDLSAYQVTNGNAWSYLPFVHSTMPALQAQAQAAHLGLWALPNPIQPSQWRKGVQ